MGKWLAEVAAAVVAGVIVWKLTTGPHLRQFFSDPSDTKESTPVITSIEGTAGTVGSNPLLKINYRSADCDVAGGRWDGASGSGLTAQFGKSGSCNKDTGFIYFGRTCFWPGVWREYITLFRAPNTMSYKKPQQIRQQARETKVS
jgi:hypothetical protein